MRIGLYDPYLDTLGGGEKYVLDIARSLQEGNNLDLFWGDERILTDVTERFGFMPLNLHLQKNFFQAGSLIHRLKTSRRYDLFFFVSDGSIPYLRAKKNILIVQFPLPWVKLTSIIDQIKLQNISTILCYSDFVKQHLDKTFHRSVTVLPPAVDPIPKSNAKKENIIVSVGRFTTGMNTKKQEVLIDVFTRHKETFQGWKLILIGGVLPTELDFVDRLKKTVGNATIEILTNVKRDTLIKYYQKAKLYWHAAGFGEDLLQHPERAEHFGITTIEAMSAGVVPLVFGAGGQREIMSGAFKALTWETTEELLLKTETLMQEPTRLAKLSHQVIKQSEAYNFEEFSRKLKEILQ